MAIKRLRIRIETNYVTYYPGSVLAELLSGPKGRRAEPHNCHASIEFRKTKRLNFHGHRG